MEARPSGPWQRFVALVDGIEHAPWGTGTLLLLLAAVIAVRNLFEILVPRNPAFEGLAAFVHYPLAYVGPFVALTLTLAAWGRVAPARVARLMILAWLLTLLPPAADLLLHAGREKPTIGYLQADPADLGHVWARFFDPRVSLAGTTPGIRIETFAAVVLAAAYVALRARSAWRAAAAAVSVYVASLFFFSLPVLVTAFFRHFDPDLTVQRMFFGDGVLFRMDADDKPDMVPILWLVPLLLALGLLWRRLERDTDDRLLPLRAVEPPARGDALVPAGAVLCGALSALSIHFPPGQPLLFGPYDFLALAAAPFAMWLLLRAVFTLKADRARAPWCAAAGLVLCAGLGRSASLGLAAAAAVFVPIGLGLFPAWSSRLVRVVAFALGSFAAYLGGYALTIGPEGFARVPLGSATFVLCAAIGYALVGIGRGRALVDGLALAVSLAAACAALGLVALAVLAVIGGAAAALLAWGTSNLRPSLYRPVLALVLAITVVALARIALSAPTVHDPWARAATCIPRLEVARGEAFERKGQWSAAEGAFRKALQCDPDYVDGLRALGLGMLHNFKTDAAGKAAPLLEKAARLAPSSSIDQANLAALYLQQNRPADALPLLDRAIALDPANLNALANRAQALEDLARKDEARTAWTLYIERASRYPEQAETVAQARQHLEAL